MAVCDVVDEISEMVGAGLTFKTSCTLFQGTTSYSSVNLSTGINSYPSGIWSVISGDNVKMIGLDVVVW